MLIELGVFTNGTQNNHSAKNWRKRAGFFCGKSNFKYKHPIPQEKRRRRIRTLKEFSGNHS